MEQTIEKEELIKSILCLIEKQDKNVFITKLLNQLDSVTLKDMIQSLVDPMYETKQDVFTKPERFTKVGKLDMK